MGGLGMGATSYQLPWECGAVAKMLVDTNGDGEYTPFDWGMVIWTSDGKIFLKKNKGDVIDPNNPDYSKLIGPLTEDDLGYIVSQYDPEVRTFIDPATLTQDSRNPAKFYKRVSLTWDGSVMPGWRIIVRNGTYSIKLIVDDVYDTRDDGVEYESVVGNVAVKTGNIVGRVLGAGDEPVVAKVSGGSASTWARAYSDEESGEFVLAGMPVNEPVRVEARAEGYVMFVKEGVVINSVDVPYDLGTITLLSGARVYGNIVIPDMPHVGDLRDKFGNVVYSLWGSVEAHGVNTSEYARKEIHVPLLPKDSTATVATVDYELYVGPGEYKVSVQLQGYFSEPQVVKVSGTEKDIRADFTLRKAVKLRGTIVLQGLTDDLRETIGEKLWVNIEAVSIDSRLRFWSGVEIPVALSTEAAGTFVMDLAPNTTYNIRIYPNLVYSMKEIKEYVGDKDRDIGVVELEPGVSLRGVVVIADDIFEYMSSLMGGVLPERKTYMHIGAKGRRTNTSQWTRIEVSGDNVVFPASYTYVLRGLQRGDDYEIRVEFERFTMEVLPPLEERVVSISTFAPVNVAVPFNITVRKPTAKVVGKVNNFTGKGIDWNKVKVMLAYIGSEGSGIPIGVKPNSRGEFVFDNVSSSRRVFMWCNEYTEEPGIKQKQQGEATVMYFDAFGKPTGNAGYWMRDLYIGGTTTYVEIDLLAGATIYVKLRSEDVSILDDIYAKTTTYVLPDESGFPAGVVRVQPMVLRRLVEDLSKMGAFEKDADLRKFSFAARLVYDGRNDSSPYLRFAANGLGEGIYNVYPLANTELCPYASLPKEEYVTLLATATAEVAFTLTGGVTVEGSVTRSQTGVEEVLKAELRNILTGRVVMSSEVRFEGNDVYLRTKSFTFKNVTPGKYVLTVLSMNYKAVSKIVEIPEGYASISLTPITLSKGASIVGRLVNEEGYPVSEGVVVECYAVPYVEGSYRNTEMPGSGISADAARLGEFRLPNLPQGTYVIRVYTKASSAVNYITTIKAGIVVPESITDVDVGTIKLVKGTTIRGVVLSPEGKPLPNISVKAYPQSAQERTRIGLEATAVTDGAGNFVLKGIDPNIKLWEVVVNYPEEEAGVGGALMREEVLLRYGKVVKSNIDVTVAGGAYIEVKLQYADAALRGKVVAPSGKSLSMPFTLSEVVTEGYPGALVLLQTQEEATSGDPMLGRKVVTQPDGSFEVAGVVSGEYWIKVFSKGCATYVSKVVLGSGEKKDVGDVRLTSGGTVRGFIRTEVGGKISQEEASIVIASTRDHSKIVFGSLAYNPVSKEIESYEIVGLEPNVEYYLVLVNPKRNKVYVYSRVVKVSSESEVKTQDIIYRKARPYFVTRALKSVMYKVVAQLLFKDYNIDFTSLPEQFNMYYIYAFMTQPILEADVLQIISTETASGIIVPLKIDDSRQKLLAVYIPLGEDLSRGYFKLRFKGTNFENIVGEKVYTFYLGEDARSEDFVNPMVGGAVELGEGDNSGVSIPAGSIQDEVAISSGCEVSVTKVTSETVGEAVLGKLAPAMFSTKLPSPASYPGELVSSIYDVKIRLVSGPLATLAEDRFVTIKLRLSTSVATSDIDKLKVYYYESMTGKWVPEKATPEVDLENNIVLVNVGHTSKFAVFKVKELVGPTTGYTGAFKSYAYPNPVKTTETGSITIKYYLPQASNGKVKVKIYIYDITGELVKKLVNDEDKEAGAIHTASWDLKNENDRDVASGVYLYYIKAGDNWKEVKKIAVIR